MFYKKGETSFSSISATIGAILIAIGVISLLALEWRYIPSSGRFLIAFVMTIVSYSLGAMLRSINYKGISESLFLLGSIMLTWAAFLFVEVLKINNPGSQVYAYVLLACWILISILAYSFKAYSNLLIAFLQFIIWIAVQYIAFNTALSHDLPISYLVISYLAVAALFYGLTQIHKAKDSIFTEAYRTFTAIYILILTYVLSFQSSLINLWRGDFNLGPWSTIFITILPLVSLIIFFAGVIYAFDRNKLSIKEISAFIGLLFSYVIIILISSMFKTLSPGLITLWLIENVVFILVILAIIGYGTRYKSEQLVNLGIIFFIIDLITRYIGIAMDLKGSLAISVMAILGGVLLILFGWLIEKWRKNLLEKARQRKDQGYAIY